METTSTFYLILGMHRSGTSCLTGSLERCGVFLGDVKGKGKHNKKGYFEKEAIYKMNDQILGLNKSSWYNPPDFPVTVLPYHYQRLESIVNELKLKTPCALKDPRTLLLIDFWRNLIGEHCQMIGTFRHPLAVAQSLMVRDKLPIKKDFNFGNTTIRFW